MKNASPIQKLEVAARGHQRKHRIARFPLRDRRQPAIVYAAFNEAQPRDFQRRRYSGAVVDCLARSEAVPVEKRFPKWIIATIASPGFESQLDDFLTTLRRYGEINHAQTVVLCVDASPDLYEIAAKHGALAVPIRAIGAIDASIKAALYSIARIVKADFYLCFDTDVFVVEDLRPLLQRIEAQPYSIHAAQSAATVQPDKPHNFIHAATRYYSAEIPEALDLQGNAPPLNFTRLNSGVFGGHQRALFCLDIAIRNHAAAAHAWINRKRSRAADELVFSLAVARLGGVAELSQVWNRQLYADDVHAEIVELHHAGNHIHARFWHGSEPQTVLHFAGELGRAKMPFIRELLEL